MNCYSAASMRQTVNNTSLEELYTISEVTADWHELMVPQRIIRSSIARASEQLDLQSSHHH